MSRWLGDVPKPGPEPADLPNSRFWPGRNSRTSSASGSEVDQGGGEAEQSGIQEGRPAESGVSGHFNEAADRELWSEELGLHPSSRLWEKTKVLMIKNLPGRCREAEVVSLVREVGRVGAKVSLLTGKRTCESSHPADPFLKECMHI